MSQPASTELQSADSNYILVHRNGIAGAVAGVMTAFLMCPLDVIRTRLQVQHLMPDHPKYTFKQIIAVMLKDEGPAAFMKGLVPQLFGLVPSWALYFTVYDHLKPVLTRATNDSMSPSIIHMMSAVGAGAITNIFTTPFFTVKTRLQTQQSNQLKRNINTPPHNGTQHHQHVYRGTMDAFKKIAKNEGMRALWSGLLPSMIGLIHVAIQFPCYEKLKEIAQSKKPTPDTPLNIGDTFLCAAGSKVFASAAAYPHEVIRSRLQGQGGFGVEKRYSGVVDVVRKTIAEEGLKGLYSGLGVTLLRTVPAAMITLSAYEKTKQLIENWAAG